MQGTDEDRARLEFFHHHKNAGKDDLTPFSLAR